MICDGKWVDENREEVTLPVFPMQEGDVLEKLLMGNFIISATPMVRRDVFDFVGYFNEDPKARIGEDWDMWLRIASRFPLAVVNEKLAYVRIHQSSMMSTITVKNKAIGLQSVVERAVSRDPDRLMHLKKHALANIYHQAGVQLIRQNEYQQSGDYFLAELKCRPLTIEAWIYWLMTKLDPGLSLPFIKAKQFLKRQFSRKQRN